MLNILRRTGEQISAGGDEKSTLIISNLLFLEQDVDTGQVFAIVV